jgi:hypothetical protein
MTGLVRGLLASSRYFILIAVVGSFVASAAALYGGFATVLIVIRTFGSLDFPRQAPSSSQSI